MSEEERVRAGLIATIELLEDVLDTKDQKIARLKRTLKSTKRAASRANARTAELRAAIDIQAHAFDGWRHQVEVAETAAVKAERRVAELEAQPKVRCFRSKAYPALLWVFGAYGRFINTDPSKRYNRRSTRSRQALAFDEAAEEITLPEALALVADWPAAVAAINKEAGL
jgi:hypothetical protein